MKKTRILASLLCIMMIVCALPVMQASAAVGDTFASIDQILGFQSVELARASYNFVGGLNAPAGSTTNVYYRNPDITGTVAYGENGMSFVPNGTSTIWYTTPAGTTIPYVPGTATVIKAQFADANDIFVFQVNHWDNATAATSSDRKRLYLEVKPDSVQSTGSLGGRSASFDFGTDEFELMYVPGEEGHQIYARKGNDAWTLLLDVEGYRSGATSGQAGISSASDVVIKSMKTYGKYVSPEEKIANILGVDTVVANPTVNFQFANNFTPSTGITTPNGAVYNDTNGLDLTNVDATIQKASWRYLPVSGWSFLDSGQALVFKAKLAEPDGALNVQAYVPIIVNGETVASRVYIDISTSRAVLSASNVNGSFAPGNDWAEYMIVKNGATGLKLYVKNESSTGGEWVLNSTINDGNYKTGGGTGTGVAFYSTCTDTTGNGGAPTTHAGAYVQYTTVYTIVEEYDSMETILGGATGSTYELDFDETTSFANTTFNNNRIGFNSTAGYKAEEDGLTLIDPSDTTSIFTWGPFSKWSPLNSTTVWGTDTYQPQALYIKAKGGFKVDTTGTNGKGRIYFIVKPGQTIVQNQDNATYKIPTVVNDEWVEYLFVPNGRTVDTDVTALGYATYIKGATTTGGVWRKIADGAFYNAGASNSNQLSFSEITGHVKQVRTLSLNASVADVETIPAGADYLYYNEEFDSVPTYRNIGTNHVTYDAGNAVFPCTDETGKIKVTLYNGIIPVGGYAEFRTRYSGTAEYYFYDGEKYISILQQSDYGSVTGGTGFSGNTNNSWRTWRIVRTKDGYTVYSKCANDTGWFRNNTTTAGNNSSAVPQMLFQFSKRNDGGIGDSMLDYVKIYGPAPTGALTLNDGYGTKTVTDGATLNYAGSLRAIVTEETGKLLVVTYNGDNMLKAQIVNVADMANDSVLVDARATGATKVKVFLWGGFDTLNNLAPAVTLNL